MNTRLARRLERLEAELRPNNEGVLKINVTRIGQPDRIIELRLPEPRNWRRRQPRQEFREKPGRQLKRLRKAIKAFA